MQPFIKLMEAYFVQFTHSREKNGTLIFYKGYDVL